MNAKKREVDRDKESMKFKKIGRDVRYETGQTQ